MPIEKDKPMPPQAIRTFTTKGKELSRTLKEAKIQPEDKITFTIEAVENEDPVTQEQQALLDRFMNVVKSKSSGDTTDFIRKQRQEMSGFNANKKEKQ